MELILFCTGEESVSEHWSLLGAAVWTLVVGRRLAARLQQVSCGQSLRTELVGQLVGWPVSQSVS